jgi:spore coat polysaccharide biosynthesis protein SpsF
MKTVAIVQARMTSTRLPGKVLRDLRGRPMLAQQIRRLRACTQIDEIAIATTTNATDDPIVELARREGVRWFRGSEHDVLDRYARAARDARADAVVRITSDCPLIDPPCVDAVVAALLRHDGPDGACDYASNVIDRTYPRGLDAEAFFRDTLERVHRLARSQPAREHVTLFILRERPDLFLLRSVADAEDNSDLRWTVDTPEDFAVVDRIYGDLGLAERQPTDVPYHHILAHARSHPDLAAINAHVVQK